MINVTQKDGRITISSEGPVEITVVEQAIVADPPIVIDPPTPDPETDTPGTDPVVIPPTPEAGRVLVDIDFAKYKPDTTYTRVLAQKDFPGHGGGASLDGGRHKIAVQDGETALAMNMKADRIGTKDAFFLPNIPLDSPKGGFPRLMAEARIFIPSDFEPVKGGKLVTSLTAGKEGAFDRPDGKVRGGNFTLMWKQEGKIQHYIRHIHQERDEFADAFESETKLPFGRWINLKHDCFIGDPGKKNGYMKTYLDGELVFETTGLDMVQPGAEFVGLWNMNIQFFFGGNTGDWKTPKQPAAGQFVYLKRYKVWIPETETSEPPTDPGTGSGGGNTGGGNTGGGNTGGGSGSSEVKIITLNDFENATLEPGKYRLAPGNQQRDITPSSKHLPGVSVDFSDFLLNGGIRFEASKDLQVLNFLSENAEGPGVVFDGNPKNIWLSGKVKNAGSHGVKISGGTEDHFPENIFLFDFWVDGTGTGESDAYNLHRKNTLQVAYAKNIWLNRCVARNVRGEEGIGLSGWNFENVYVVDCDIQSGPSKIGGHGSKNVWVHGGKHDILHSKYCDGYLILSGNIAPCELELAVQKNHDAGKVSQDVRIVESLRNVISVNNNQGATITYIPDLVAPVMPLWPY